MVEIVDWGIAAVGRAKRRRRVDAYKIVQEQTELTINQGVYL